MDRKVFLNKLAVLQEELQEDEAFDDDARQKLADVRADIDQMLDEEQEDPDRDTFAERLQDAVYQFEASHPQIAKSINNVLNTLSNMGI